MPPSSFTFASPAFSTLPALFSANNAMRKRTIIITIKNFIATSLFGRGPGSACCRGHPYPNKKARLHFQQPGPEVTPKTLCAWNFPIARPLVHAYSSPAAIEASLHLLCAAEICTGMVKWPFRYHCIKQTKKPGCIFRRPGAEVTPKTFKCSEFSNSPAFDTCVPLPCRC